MYGGPPVLSDRPNFRFGRSSAELSDREKAQKFLTKMSVRPNPGRTELLAGP